jgi:predicted SprT family Zn-dependent metalloprotease
MLLEDAKTLALLHMEEYGVDDKFTFEFEDCKRTLGRCHYYTKKITLSKWYAELNEEKEIEDTILHEIAHALAWTHNKFKGHGKIWKDWARKVGATPKACSKANLAKPTNHYKYEQTCCGVTYKRHRLRKNARYFCPNCKGKLFK